MLDYFLKQPITIHSGKPVAVLFRKLPTIEQYLWRIKNRYLRPIKAASFMLNSPIEYPNALVDTLFLSNPEEAMKILDPEFQQQMADKIETGIKDFLEGCKGT